MPKLSLENFIGQIPCQVFEGKRVAVALSGGADSMALLTLLSQMRQEYVGLEVIALHCNFHLRGEESDAETDFCIDFARHLGVEIEVKHFPDTRQLSESSGDSIEMVCRNLRYEWFRTYTDQGYFVALGHHRDDNRETVFLNMLRGTGLKGLTGMEPIDLKRRLFRPLLTFSKADITDYLRANSVEWRTDSSNMVADVLRNRLRLNVMPAIDSDFPAGRTQIDATIDNLRTDYALLNEYLEVLRYRFFDADNGELMLDGIRKATSVPQRVVFEVLYPYGFNWRQCEDITAVANSGWKKFLVADYVVFTDGKRALLRPRNTDDGERSELVESGTLEDLALLSGAFVMSTVEGDDLKSLLDNIRSLTPSTLVMDADKVDRVSGEGSWKWRHIRKGDRMRPFGLKGRGRLISDILSDAHASPIEKNSQCVLEDPQGNICWLPGYRTSTHHLVDKNTRRAYILRMP